ncbi:MAG: hypothetical protein ACTSRZ_06635 [Promethearchaeota archaeon]
MSDLPPIRPPKLPPTEGPKKLDEDMCVIHHGPLQGKVYKCNGCGAKMCFSCAYKWKFEKNNLHCPICSSFIFIKKEEK